MQWTMRHTVVLGGDIFDFKWSTYETLDHSLDSAERWLGELYDRSNDCRFHFVLGNHDCHPRFIERLKRFSQCRDRFYWHRYFVRIDHCLFLHGDVVAKGAHDHFVLETLRRKHHYKKNKPKVSHLAYDLVVKTRMHRVAMFAIREEVVLQRIRGYAESIGHGPDEGVTDVFFGHTHIRIDGIEYTDFGFITAAARSMVCHLGC